MRDEYLDWLCSLLGIKDINFHPHSILLRILYSVEFRLTDPIIGHDDNRISDAYNLRGDYLDAFPNSDIPHCFSSQPNVFEVLIAFSMRIDDDIMYNGELRASKWFWIMIQNLNMLDFTNENEEISWDQRDVMSILDVLMSRSYEFNGKGGLFPLKYTAFDQRKVEMWYQMSNYFDENY